MVVVRLSRGGAKKRPFYHIVVADKRCARDGRYIERVGYFNPLATGHVTSFSVNRERVTYWLEKGAQLSVRVKTLIAKWDSQKLSG